MTGTSVEGRLFLVAVTGSMGCGKSLVTQMFSKKGAKCLDADQTAREVLAPGERGWCSVLDRFGTQMLLGDGPLEKRSIDRRALGRYVFDHPEARSDLEKIIHPLIQAHHFHILTQWQKQTHPGSVDVVVAEIPLLFETQGQHRFDLSIAVMCGKNQWQRLLARTSMDDATKQAVITQQMSEDKKKVCADFVIDNSGPLTYTEQQVVILMDKIETIKQQKAPLAWPHQWSDCPLV